MPAGPGNCLLPCAKRQMPTTGRASRLPVQEWTKYQDRIRDLYIRQDKTLKQLVKIMRQDHAFHATPRQYVEKFRSWGLYKYERRNGDHRPLHTSSTYRNPSVPRRSRGSLASVTSTPDHDSASEFQAVGGLDYHDLDPPEHMGRRPQRSTILNPISGTEGATSSPTIPGHDDEDPISEDNRTSPPMQKSYGATTSGLSTSYVSASSVRPFWNSLYGQDVPWLELDGEALSHLDTPREAHDIQQEAKRRLQKQNAVALALWKLWYGGVLDDFEDYQARGLDMPAPAFIELDLKVWLRLYPWTGETVFDYDLPSFPEPDDPGPTWKEYARYGHAIALMKSGSMPVHAPADNNQFGRRLTAAMLLAREGSRALRRCFESILASFDLELGYQYDHLEKPCERFAKQFSLRLSETEERNIAGHSDQTKAAAILAMVCHNELVNGELHSTLDDLRTQCQQSAEFSTKRAFVWAARLMLYYASPELENSPLPTHLCARAVDGCKRILKMIHYHPHQELEGLKGRGDGNGPMPEEWQDANFAGLWTEWICYDSHFFLYDPLA